MRASCCLVAALACECLQQPLSLNHEPNRLFQIACICVPVDDRSSTTQAAISFEPHPSLRCRAALMLKTTERAWGEWRPPHQLRQLELGWPPKPSKSCGVTHVKLRLAKRISRGLQSGSQQQQLTAVVACSVSAASSTAAPRVA